MAGKKDPKYPDYMGEDGTSREDYMKYIKMLDTTKPANRPNLLKQILEMLKGAPVRNVAPGKSRTAAKKAAVAKKSKIPMSPTR
jgi:hypothetical protein